MMLLNVIFLFLLEAAAVGEGSYPLFFQRASLSHIPPEKRQSFLDLSRQMRELEQKNPFIFRLVDKKNPLPKGYEPDGLKNVDDYPQLTSKRNGLLVQETALFALLDLQEAARQEKLSIPLLSAYRSYEYQQRVHDYWRRRSKDAERFSAIAGYSQHQLGTVVDLGSLSQTFAQTNEGRWLTKNSCRFGFSLSYPAGQEEYTGYIYEPWHFRFIGKAACQLQQRFFDNSQQQLLEFWQNFSSSSSDKDD